MIELHPRMEQLNHLEREIKNVVLLKMLRCVAKHGFKTLVTMLT
jgi:hypothetical protein